MEVRRKFNKTVYFGELPQGKCFSLNGDLDTIYMKISPVKDSDYKEWNAVRLCDGDISTFHELQEVIPISGVFEID